MDLRLLRRRLLLMPLLLGAVALFLLFSLDGGQAGGAVLIGPIPVAVGTSPAAAAAALLLLFGLLVVTTGRLLKAAAEAERERRSREPLPPSPAEGPPGEVRERKGRVRGAGVVMVGPLPIAWGNDPRLLRFTLLLAAALTALGVGAMLLSPG
jgi:uncharacterized protein (TIGR00304 family)